MSYSKKTKELADANRQLADRAKLQSQAADSGRSNNSSQDDKLNLTGGYMCPLRPKPVGNPQSAKGNIVFYKAGFMVTDLATQAQNLVNLTTALGEPLVHWDAEKGELTINAYKKLYKEEKDALLEDRKARLSVPGLTEAEREDIRESLKRPVIKTEIIREGTILTKLEFYTQPPIELIPTQLVQVKGIQYAMNPNKKDPSVLHFNRNAKEMVPLAPRHADHATDFYLKNPSKDSMIFEWGERERYNGERWVGYAPESRVYQVMNYQNPDPFGVRDSGIISVYCVTDDDPKAHYTQPKEGSGKSVKKIIKASWVQSQMYAGRRQDITVLVNFEPYHPETWVETQTGISNPEFWGAMAASHCPPMFITGRPVSSTSNQSLVQLKVESYHIWLLYWLMQCFVRVPESYVKEQLAMQKRLQGQSGGDDVSTLTFQTADGRVNLLNAKATPKDDRNFLANCVNLYEYTGKTSMIFNQGNTFVVMESTKMPIYLRVGLPQLSEEDAVAWLSGKPVAISVDDDPKGDGMKDELPIFDQRTDKMIYCVPKALAEKIAPVLNSFELEVDQNGVGVIEADATELAAMEAAMANTSPKRDREEEEETPGKKKKDKGNKKRKKKKNKAKE